jgi:hypothetical protein
MNTALEFTNGLVLARDHLYLSGSLDSLPAFSAHTYLIVYDETDIPDIWSHHDVDWWNVALVHFQGKKFYLCAMSQEGEIEFMRRGEGIRDDDVEDDFNEKIPGAGVFAEDAKCWGYMSGLRQIGNHLYACGGAGQVYKREGPNRWVHMDRGILQKPDVKERLLPDDINGPHESAIYLVGCIGAPYHPPFVYFWNGKAWCNISLPEVAERITNIFVESETRIWLCGKNGTLLLGNANEGFKSLSTVEDNQLFTSMAMFEGKLYLASNLVSCVI